MQNLCFPNPIFNPAKSSISECSGICRIGHRGVSIMCNVPSYYRIWDLPLTGQDFWYISLNTVFWNPITNPESATDCPLTQLLQSADWRASYCYDCKWQIMSDFWKYTMTIDGHMVHCMASDCFRELYYVVSGIVLHMYMYVALIRARQINALFDGFPACIFDELRF